MRTHTAVVKTLLASRETSIRWKTRVEVLGDDPGSQALRVLQEEIRQSPRVRALLAHREELGRPGTARRVYYKWQGVHWVLASLADLGYPPGDSGLHAIRDRVLELWLDPRFYREFEARTEAQAYRKRGVPRLRGRYRRCGSQQGNALYFLTRLGIDDGHGDALAERLLHWQWPDGGWNCDRNPSADTSSFAETLLPMKGLALYARRRRSARAAEAATRASEVFLKRRLFRRVSDGSVIDPAFLRLHYPLYWHYDILGGLRGMVAVGRARDPRCEEALDLLESKRLSDGGWATEAKFYQKSSPRFEASADYVDWGGTRAHRMNEWVTVDALSVLATGGRLSM